MRGRRKLDFLPGDDLQPHKTSMQKAHQFTAAKALRRLPSWASRNGSIVAREVEASRQESPRLSYAADKLFLKDGELFYAAGTPRMPYMNTPEVSITGKVSSTPDAERNGLVWTYSFTLNAPTDVTWDELFRKNFKFARHVAPEFNGTSMLLTCEPVNLKSRYDAVKDAMLKTNADYKTERANLIKRVEQLQRAKEAAAQKKAELERQVRAEFDSLEL